ncbi:uncharacterized protein LOC128267583 [Anopheles cruzii]|uniref:uncharacterized protein LOC128267583 n=1 Tax=Anopheles cruzii TaxID=68878 RepID=UPI0022EC5CFC|nr:uncharacterized protein LOC128267583 [Anopheles cruzii]
MKKLRLIALIVYRILITSAVFCAALVLIYLTAIDPKERVTSCERVCNGVDWPRICRFQLVIQKRIIYPDKLPQPKSVNGNSTINRKFSKKEEPIVYYTVNGRFVGPTITVCENDFLVVDVECQIPGESISLHWTGQSQRRTPWADGVPMITQCPITSFTRFQYTFQTDKAGTHLYHGFSGVERTRGLLGALVVRSAGEQRNHGTIPPTESVWVVVEVNGVLTVNGQHHWQETLPRAAASLRHRVRLVYVSRYQCQHWLELEDHRMQVLALDGNLLEPKMVKRVLLHDGIRVDLAIILEQVPKRVKSNFEIRFTSMNDNGDGGGQTCSQEQSVFRFQYEPSRTVDDDSDALYIASLPPTNKNELDLGGGLCDVQEPQRVLCLRDLRALLKDQFPKEFHSYDTRLEFTISSQVVEELGPLEDDTYYEVVRSVNGFTFAFPSVMMLREPVSAELRSHTCGHRRMPRKCHPLMDRCECVHVAHLETGHRVEMVLINTDPSTDYVYHLHGHTFFVVGIGERSAELRQSVSLNLDRPIGRDTIVVRRDTVVIVRFVAKNAGLWLLRDIGSERWTRGLDVVLNVSTRHQTALALPVNFPTCRHFVGPRYFLI